MSIEGKRTVKTLIEEMEHGEKVCVYRDLGDASMGDGFSPCDQYDLIEAWAADLLEAAIVNGWDGNDIRQHAKGERNE